MVVMLNLATIGKDIGECRGGDAEAGKPRFPSGKERLFAFAS